jgi:ADP-heptose:LPS heptosyltransferase
MRNGQKNPKNYPWWPEVIKQLREEQIYVIQIGTSNRDEIPMDVDELLLDLSFDQLEELVINCDTWASVDNFFHHFCSLLNKPGVVVFGKSDPNIFGYLINNNLLKDRKYLRELQFDIWEHESFTPKCFVSPDIVVDAIKKML